MNIKRQPIVVVLGHVDHGKTSLLDALRNSDVTANEAGGITQSIGASVVDTKDKNKITFIDTPGHALFSGMRSRGVNIADVALLIVDGSGGVKPQTKEAIKLIQDSKIPFITVITKIDLPAASVDVVLAELEKEGLYFEGRGGQIPYIGVSARKKEKLDELIDLILLLSEINNIEGDSEAELESYVIETNKDKGGNMVSVVVKNGQLKIGQDVFSDYSDGKVKGLYDFQNKQVKEINIGEPAKILGFNSLPEIGALVSDHSIDKQSLSLGPKQNAGLRDKTKIGIYLKANSAGSLEALVASIPSEFTILDSSVGDVTESDVLNAKANNALIFVFESKISGSVKKLAEMDKVKIERYDIIYKLLERLDEIVKGGLIEILGRAEISAIFPFDSKKVAGSKILQGRIDKAGDIRIMRADKELGKVKIISIKKQKQEVQGASQGEECGILFVPQLDFQIGDVIVAVKV